MQFKIIEKRKEIDNVFSLIFQPQEPVTWEAGQFVLYKIPHDHPDDRGDTRIFTISSPPYQKKIMLTTRYFFQDSSTFKKALFAKNSGESIEALKIQGNFTVADEDKKLVFIAGGIGITPFHSILLDLENKKKIKDIILIYSNKDENSIVFKDTMNRLSEKFQGLKIHYIFPPQRCDHLLIKETVSDIQERTFYLSGPILMVRSVEEALQKLQVNVKKVKKDYFPGISE